MRSLLFVTTFAVLALPAAPVLAQRATTGYTVRATSLRAGPAYDYPLVRRVARNAGVDVYGCLRDRSWCDVGYRSDRGWMPARDLVVDYRGRRQGISLYPGIGVLTFIFGSYWDSHYRNNRFYADRPRWERQYYDKYQNAWGPRPQTPPAYRQPGRPPVQPGRPRPQLQQPQPQGHPQRQPQFQPRPQPQPQFQPRQLHQGGPNPVPTGPGVAPVNPRGSATSPVRMRPNPGAQPGPAPRRGGQQGEDRKPPEAR